MTNLLCTTLMAMAAPPQPVSADDAGVDVAADTLSIEAIEGPASSAYALPIDSPEPDAAAGEDGTTGLALEADGYRLVVDGGGHLGGGAAGRSGYAALAAMVPLSAAPNRGKKLIEQRCREAWYMLIVRCGAVLPQAWVNAAYLWRHDWHGVDLRGCALPEYQHFVRLRGARLSGRQVERMVAEQERFMELVQFSSPQPDHRRTVEELLLFDYDLRGADLRRIAAQQVSFDGADLRGARLPDDCATSSFDKSKLDGVAVKHILSRRGLITGADLRGADLRRIAAQQVSFDGADLRGAQLPANCAGIDFAKARLDRAEVVHILKQQGSIAGANLAGSDLSELDLGEMDLSAVDLRGAVLCQTNLQLASLPEDCRGINFAGAVLDGVGITWIVAHGGSIQGVELSQDDSPIGCLCQLIPPGAEPDQDALEDHAAIAVVVKGESRIVLAGRSTLYKDRLSVQDPETMQWLEIPVTDIKGYLGRVGDLVAARQSRLLEQFPHLAPAFALAAGQELYTVVAAPATASGGPQGSVVVSCGRKSAIRALFLSGSTIQLKSISYPYQPMTVDLALHRVWDSDPLAAFEKAFPDVGRIRAMAGGGVAQAFVLTAAGRVLRFDMEPALRILNRGYLSFSGSPYSPMYGNFTDSPDSIDVTAIAGLYSDLATAARAQCTHFISRPDVQGLLDAKPQLRGIFERLAAGERVFVTIGERGFEFAPEDGVEMCKTGADSLEIWLGGNALTPAAIADDTVSFFDSRAVLLEQRLARHPNRDVLRQIIEGVYGDEFVADEGQKGQDRGLQDITLTRQQLLAAVLLGSDDISLGYWRSFEIGRLIINPRRPA